MKKLLTVLLTTVFIVMLSVPLMAKKADAPGQMKEKNPNAALNSGVGNGPEFGVCEDCDSDPGNSQDNNKAGKNSGKPSSDAAVGCDGGCDDPDDEEPEPEPEEEPEE